jgi:hypothetical protein
MFRRSINDAPAPETVHFNVGNVGSPSLATPGTATPAALAFFGQINIRYACTIAVNHLHMIDDGSSPGRLELELWRRRSGTMTRLTQLSYVAPAGSDYVTIEAVPADPDLLAGDYLFCQAVTGTNLSNVGNGLTVDVHFRY